MKCPNCNAENAEGMKFCGECGTKLPEPMNHCPTCNKDWPINMKFCGECGFKFGGGSAAGTSIGSGAIALGDKNVIAGDIVSNVSNVDNSHTTINTTNNTTIVNNLKEHETCACCGKSIGPADSFFKCQECGHIVCDRCYDYETKCCLSCGTEKNKNRYKTLQEEILANPYKYDIDEIVKTEEYFHDSRIQAFLADWYIEDYLFDKGFEYAQKSASQDNADGIGILGYCYVCGNGTVKNPEKGMELLEKSVSLNSLAGITRYGDVFFDGKLDSKDKNKALEWYTKAVEKNYIPAISNIGVYYKNEKDYEKAVEYLERAVSFDYLPAIVSLGDLYNSIYKDYAKAYDLFTRATNKKFIPGYSNLGILYANGHGVSKDADKAIELFEKSKDHPNSWLSLATIYINKGQHENAFGWIEKAANAEIPVAVHLLGLYYEKGLSVLPNKELAQKYYQRAKELGYEGK